MTEKENVVTNQDGSTPTPSVSKQETTDSAAPTQTVTPTSQSFNITTEQLLDLLGKLNQPKENLEKVIAGLAKAIEPDYAGRKLYDEADIDKNDYLTTPAL